MKPLADILQLNPASETKTFKKGDFIQQAKALDRVVEY